MAQIDLASAFLAAQQIRQSQAAQAAQEAERARQEQTRQLLSQALLTTNPNLDPSMQALLQAAPQTALPLIQQQAQATAEAQKQERLNNLIWLAQQGQPEQLQREFPEVAGKFFTQQKTQREIQKPLVDIKGFNEFLADRYGINPETLTMDQRTQLIEEHAKGNLQAFNNAARSAGATKFIMPGERQGAREGFAGLTNKQAEDATDTIKQAQKTVLAIRELGPITQEMVSLQGAIGQPIKSLLSRATGSLTPEQKRALTARQTLLSKFGIIKLAYQKTAISGQLSDRDTALVAKVTRDPDAASVEELAAAVRVMGDAARSAAAQSMVLFQEGVPMSMEEFDAQVDRIEATRQQLGVGPGERASKEAALRAIIANPDAPPRVKNKAQIELRKLGL